MHILSVTSCPDGLSGIYNLSVDAVNYMEGDSAQRRVVIYTLTDVFYMPGSIKFWQTALNNSGYAFADIDRNILVNSANVKLLDSDKKEAYFDYEIKKQSQRCGIAFHKYKVHELFIRTFNPDVVIR
ncbi:LytTR family transcriptional regulator DNA-binding domain-containing protein [Bacillus sp. FJAT-26390]|uniref:LytTR family transcriptional regulator DNA-binding domain-containing protein n=1 Tax=Bacillus sp. FJAT-26390 TaxID=1743142 RepID=UPI000807C86D|nr:LytTR family transcriptional regulator DNA-binding domain-containing protein [Bacillus sp. FJAT-26390]OBZ08031.1 hypothetical protein A7975_27270 [Bacillus sp. FJAT-26390]